MKYNVNRHIALTHISTRKKQTLVASMGVTIGLALYIFSNSLINGFSEYSRAQMFKSVPHLRIFNEDEISVPLMGNETPNTIALISNPKITNTSKKIIDPYALMNRIRQMPFITSVSPQVNTDIFFINGNSRLKGVGYGVLISQADAMFNIQSTMLAGNLESLSSDMNAILIGKGIAEKLNLRLEDNITIISARGAIKVMRIKGIFSTGNKATDESKSYVSITAAQQLERQGPEFITDIYAGTSDPDSALQYAEALKPITPYTVEAWQTSNADTLNEERVQKSMNSIVAVAILMIAGFGIYNILNMTITQKMNDIAILKANGFAGKDIIRIFVTEAFIMGLLGTILGMIIGGILMKLLSGVYVGEPIGYFPISYDPFIFIKAGLFGMTVSLGAGYLPARKAAKIDPVAIFRK